MADRQIRIALVMYGGISLAIYENGVARSFYDLVKRKGPMALLLDLLESDAVVDVIAGASAGGINGIMLAAALEAGEKKGENQFLQTARLWRDVGDFGELLRKMHEAENAESLLSGDYYQNELVKAFEGILDGSDDEEEIGEIDLFITGTDLHGHVSTICRTGLSFGWNIAMGEKDLDYPGKVCHRPRKRNEPRKHISSHHLHALLPVFPPRFLLFIWIKSFRKKIAKL